MYDGTFQINILNDLGNKVDSIVNTIITLNSQGYIVNNNKYTKLSFASILIHAYENIGIYNDKQKTNIELIYNNVFGV